MRQGGEQRVTQAFPLAGQPGLLFAGGQGEALGALATSRVKVSSSRCCSGIINWRRFSGSTTSSPRAGGALQGQDLIRHAGQGIGAGAGRLALIKAPAGDGIIPRGQPRLVG